MNNPATTGDPRRVLLQRQLEIKWRFATDFVLDRVDLEQDLSRRTREALRAVIGVLVPAMADIWRLRGIRTIGGTETPISPGHLRLPRWSCSGLGWLAPAFRR